MTTEEKAKAFDEALERARKSLRAAGDVGTDIVTFIFPELRESEDERIIKTLQEYVKNRNWRLNGPTQGEVLAWLEKQKENIEKEYVFRPLVGTDINTAALQAIRRANEGDRLVLAFNGAYIPVRKGCNANKIVDIYDTFIEKQKEQKPVVTHGETYHVDTLGTQQVIVGKMPQKPVEWSEEDEEILDGIINTLDRLGYAEFCKSSREEDIEEERFYYKEIQCLKKLKSLRPSWKPTDDEERLINTSISFLKDFADKGYENAVECIDWLKSKLNGDTCK